MLKISHAKCHVMQLYVTSVRTNQEGNCEICGDVTFVGMSHLWGCHICGDVTYVGMSHLWEC